MKKFALFFWGSLIGALNGFFGSGGGVAAVLVLENFLKIEPKKAHATAVLIILPLCAVSVLVYARGGYFQWDMIWKASLGGSIGGFLGARLLPKIPQRYIHKIFGVLLLAAGIRMVF